MYLVEISPENKSFRKLQGELNARAIVEGRVKSIAGFRQKYKNCIALKDPEYSVILQDDLNRIKQKIIIDISIFEQSRDDEDMGSLIIELSGLILKIDDMISELKLIK